MEIKQLERTEARDFVRLLFTCHEVEFTHLFGDTFSAIEILINYYSNLNDYRGILIAKAGKKVAGLIEIWMKEFKRKKLPFKDFIRSFGFIKGLRCRLLLSYFSMKPKGDEAYIRFFCVHPNLSLDIGRNLLDKAIELARSMGKRKISIWLPVESDLVDICIERGFKIKKMLDSNFAEKYFGKRYYYLLELSEQALH